MKERYQRSFFGCKDYVRIFFVVKSDGILFRLSYSGEGIVFFERWRFVKKRKKGKKSE